MEMLKTQLNDVILIKPTVFSDNRGIMHKQFDANSMKQYSLLDEVKESFFSQSHFNVIRGFHYQKFSTKILTLVSGKVYDVTFDLRKDSSTFGKHQVIELDAKDGLSLYMPPGIAHAYHITSPDGAVFNYLCSHPHGPGHEDGFHWSSFGVSWNTNNPIISDRDRDLKQYNGESV